MGFQISQQAIDRYLQRRLSDLGLLKMARTKHDYASIRSVAHQIRGNALTFGFSELGEHASVLETLAVERNDPELSKEISWFEKWIKEKTSKLSLQTQQ